MPSPSNISKQTGLLQGNQVNPGGNYLITTFNMGSYSGVPIIRGIIDYKVVEGTYTVHGGTDSVTALIYKLS